MKKSCKNDEESGRKKMQKIRCKIQEKKRAVITDITQSCREM